MRTLTNLGTEQTKNSASSPWRESSIEERYLRLMRLSLTRSFPEAKYAEIPRNTRTFVKRIRYLGYATVQRLLRRSQLALVQANRSTGETMMGMGALEN